jgi:Enoyl-(Acyl carrier protein) reductase
MSDRFIDWLFGTLISVDVQHQELLRGFGVLLLIPFALFLLSYVRVSYFAFIKDRARKGALDTVTRVLAAGLSPRNIRVNSIAPGASRPKGCMRRASSGRIDPMYVHSSAAAEPVGGIQRQELILLSGGLP